MSMSWSDDNKDADPSVDLAIEKLHYPQFLLNGQFSIMEIADRIQKIQAAGGRVDQVIGKDEDTLILYTAPKEIQ